MGDTDGYTIITDVRQIDFNDETAVMAEIEQFAETYAYADIEHALVITPAGKVYSLVGNEDTVNPAVIDRNELEGSIVIHNHPVEFGLNMGDSFSRRDLYFAVEYNTRQQYLVSGERRNVLEFTKKYTANDVYDVWSNAEIKLRQTRTTRTDLTFRQEAILKAINNTAEGIVFYDEF
ncbi:MAG: hypothetical protein FWC89_11320 [Defluviitaleaceae bacterium]|nr:hypothetical protein [Defluviitaleaceae bacterium]